MPSAIQMQLSFTPFCPITLFETLSWKEDVYVTFQLIFATSNLCNPNLNLWLSGRMEAKLKTWWKPIFFKYLSFVKTQTVISRLGGGGAWENKKINSTFFFFFSEVLVISTSFLCHLQSLLKTFWLCRGKGDQPFWVAVCQCRHYFFPIWMLVVINETESM